MSGGRINRDGYRHYTGALLSPESRFWVVFEQQLFWVIRNRRARLLLLVALAPMVVSVIALMARMGGDAAGFSTDGFVEEMLKGMLIAEVHIGAFIAAAAGSGAVADERRTNAMLLYLSRPVCERRYLLAKGLAVASLLFVAIALPGLLFVVADIMVVANINLAMTGRHALGIVALGALVGTAFGSTVLLFSTLAKRAAYPALAWLALFYFSGMLVGMAGLAGDLDNNLSMLALPILIHRLTSWLVEGVGGPAPLFAALCWIALVLGLLVWRSGRLRKLAVLR